jgi:hypothetical protein
MKFIVEIADDDIDDVFGDVGAQEACDELKELLEDSFNEAKVTSYEQ